MRTVNINPVLETVFTVKCDKVSIPIARCERCINCLDISYEYMVVFCACEP
jgi:hypothetical protein